MEGLILHSGVTAVEGCDNYSLALHVQWFDLTLRTVRSNRTECLGLERSVPSPRAAAEAGHEVKYVQCSAKCSIRRFL